MSQQPPQETLENNGAASRVVRRAEGEAENLCTICVEKHNKTTRLKIKCQYCDFMACRSCCEKYVLSENTPKCMNNQCNREWTRQYMKTVFTSVFLEKPYKKHREQILFHNELALMPATQPFVENEIAKEKISRDIVELKKKQHELSMEMLLLHREYNLLGRRNINRERAVFVRACPEETCRGFLSTQWKCGICEKWTCPRCHILIGLDKNAEHECNEDDIATATLLNNDTKPCPKCGTGIFKIDGCFGKNTPIMMFDGTEKMSQDIKVGDMLMGDDGTQRLVDELFSGVDVLYNIQQTHGGMHYVVNSKHTIVLKYQEYTIEVQLSDYIVTEFEIRNQLNGLKMDEKNQEVKTDIKVTYLGRGVYYGWSVDNNKRFLLKDKTVVRNCDQMWCTQCNTAFSWRTGQIETNTIHNPHYYEWLRRTNNGEIPRNPDDNPCVNREINHVFMRHLNIQLNSPRLKDSRNTTFENTKKIIYTYCQNITHLRGIDLRTYDYDAVHAADNQKLRIQFMRNFITEEIYKKNIQQNDKKKQKKKEIFNILSMVIDTIKDIIYRFYIDIQERNFDLNDVSHLSEIDKIREYANECLLDVSKTYSSRQLLVNDNLRFGFIPVNYVRETTTV